MPTLHVQCDTTPYPRPIGEGEPFLLLSDCHDYLNLSFWLSKLILTFWIVDSFGDFKSHGPLKSPTLHIFFHRKSQMQLNTDFHMHYLNASEERYLYSLMNPNNLISSLKKALIWGRLSVCECGITWAFTLSGFFKLLILCIVFTRLLLRATNQTLVQKNLFLTDHGVSGCKAVVECREGPHKSRVVFLMSFSASQDQWQW